MKLLPIIPLLTPLLISDVEQATMSHTESALQGTELRSQLAPSQDSFWSAQVSATIKGGLRRHHGFVWLVSDLLPRLRPTLH